MTYLPAQVMGRWFYLYLILDLYSRKIVGWRTRLTTPTMRRTALTEGIAALSSMPVLHGDNGATLKATTVLAMLNWLGVKPSYSRPCVSDDNAYARTLSRCFARPSTGPSSPPRALPISTKRAPGRPGSCIGTNFDHRHSGIRYLSPAQRHAGAGRATPKSGRPSAPSRSTPNATASSRRVRLAMTFSRWLHD